MRQFGEGWRKPPMYTLTATDAANHAVCAGFKAGQSKAGGIGWAEELAATLSAQCSGTEPTVYDARGNGDGEIVNTMTGDHQNRVTDYTTLVFDTTQITSPQNGCNPHYGDPCHPLAAGAHPPVLIMESAQANARRLTPLECERLQGYPDGWTDIGEWVDSKGKKHKPADSPRYKALGNSIALPFWFWLLRRISAQYYRPATLGSLFDGIGGFPLCWERCNGKGTALWASEIEEFPIAVTKQRLKEELREVMET